ncbi:hypothetical protein A2334_05960 [Candidatus Roizmanbacteria bacterium RIFOXYB2_FULL_38_10]|uniref:Glycosyltransferase RgtA/B/C/D-like domain-containing protein n=1 Tax=Candidatus Roizmanbacteria bacterium RIFOXYD1_FULL_38_12 TaxID=1802093 RepID=A0A1F7L0U2_9BACT|nr:MAG: hypothetical protein A3K47_03080 [Candidatus Roizmanbacteria bacterium RIFOXYA2_FULL_38_14]OGK63750.1 MAG: hypothetical protein A3K27_03080 [Candidatus Roizmanbacteria bacterium RIFOXYA1_FULL_37_12]OGK65596.1 MAG: hypothetical protein A3K38_03080 [Candidatus Roizmanbacteria bacterium RIFOXYB1_FULL_40_23]OGK68379.1 MAG: hypothetical protein A2334_05960 [Candidatus Roizmanbacteria bacterium RIFOXYB2_FULL_38_10]OGK70001.1 MAG: hypothetical protein A3K21_03085 [Candidatus Roizmanbacteria ba
MSKKLFVIILLLFFILTASGNIDSIDATTHLYLAKQIVTQSRIDFGKDVIGSQMVAQSDPKTGNYYPIYNFGYAVLLIPAVLLSNSIRTLLHTSPSLFPQQPDWIMTAYLNLFNGVVLILIGYMIRRFVYQLVRDRSEKINIFMLVGIFASNLIIQGHQQFAHLLFSLFVLLALDQLTQYAHHNRAINIILFSLAFAAVAASYNTTFIFLIPALLIYYVFASEKKQRNVYQTLKLGLSFLPAIAVQGIWNYLRYGNPLLTGYLQRAEAIYVFNIGEMIKHLYGMTIGPNKGLLIYSPILFFSYLYCLKNMKTKNKSVRSLIVFFLTLTVSYLLGYSPVTFWHGDSAYGPRYLTPLVVVGLVFFILFMQETKTKMAKIIITLFIFFGVLVQIPGLLIPHFTYRFISKQTCVGSERWYYDFRCAPFLVGWAQLLKRETKETPLIFKGDQSDKIVTDKYPNPLTPFKTIYPDPFFDRFSSLKTSRYKVSEDLFNCIYAFTLDMWWIKKYYYANIF